MLRRSNSKQPFLGPPPPAFKEEEEELY